MSERPASSELTGEEVYALLISGEPRYRCASKLDPHTLALTSVLVGDGETKQVFDIALHKLPELSRMAALQGWPDAEQIQRLETHWLAGQSGLEGRA